MAENFYYNEAQLQIVNNTLDMTAITAKVMLVRDVHTPNQDHTNVGQISADELSVTGYTGGFGGAGRQTAAVAITKDDTLDKVIKQFNGGAQMTWNTLAAGQNIKYAVLIFETGGSDANSLPIICWNVGVASSIPTNGGDFSLNFATTAAGGNAEYENLDT